jgi:Rrf2 family transcriptional repressor of oqxAB
MYISTIHIRSEDEMADLRFSTALQALMLLANAVRKGAPLVSSTQLGECLKTNPSLVRALLAPLFQAGLVETTRGRNGGVRLAKDADRITLWDVHQASGCGTAIWEFRADVGDHPGAIRANDYLNRLNDQAGAAVAAVLAGQTLAEALDAVVS